MDFESLKEALEKAKALLLENPEVEKVWEDLKEFGDFSDILETPSHIKFLVKKVIEAIEIVEDEVGQLSREEFIDTAAQLLDDLIKFKGWAIVFEAFDDKFFKFVVSLLYDKIDERI